MDMLPAEPERNFPHAEELIRRAVKTERPDVVVLPETWNTGFAPGKIDSALADEDGERTRSVFSALAKELGVNIVAGSVCQPQKRQTLQHRVCLRPCWRMPRGL